MTAHSTLLHELPVSTAERAGDHAALSFGSAALSYAELAWQLAQFASGMRALGVERGERVAVYLDKRFETVVACFGAAAAGAAFVPVNPLLKAEQVGYILRDCNVRVLVTSAERYAL